MLKQAQADFELKQSIYDRYLKLSDTNSLPKNDLDIARANLSMAKASVQRTNVELEKAHKDLMNTEVKAAISGFVVSRKVDQGTWVNQGDTLYKIINIDTVTVRLLASEFDIQQLKIGQPLELWSEVDPSRKIIGTINRIGITADPERFAYPVELDIDNVGHHLKPGMSVHAVGVKP